MGSPQGQTDPRHSVEQDKKSITVLLTKIKKKLYLLKLCLGFFCHWVYTEVCFTYLHPQDFALLVQLLDTNTNYSRNPMSLETFAEFPLTS